MVFFLGDVVRVCVLSCGPAEQLDASVWAYIVFLIAVGLADNLPV